MKKNKILGWILIVSGGVLATSVFTDERSMSNFYTSLFFIGMGWYSLNKKR